MQALCRTNDSPLNKYDLQFHSVAITILESAHTPNDNKRSAETTSR